MKKLLMLALLLCAPLALCQTTTMSARDYYDELYKAGGLDRMADEYVCFREDQEPNFFTLALSKDIREFMMADGSFSKLPKALQDGMKKDFVAVRGYAKGIPFADRQEMSKDGDSWVGDERKLGKDGKFIRERLTVNWQTLRFKRSIETFNADSTFIGELPSFGKCEHVSPAIRQRAD